MFLPRKSKSKFYTCFKCAKKYIDNGTIFCSECSLNKLNTKKLDVDKFKTGITEDVLRECPGCSEKTCYYMGITPSAIKCSNKLCRWYEAYEDKGKK